MNATCFLLILFLISSYFSACSSPPFYNITQKLWDTFENMFCINLLFIYCTLLQLSVYFMQVWRRNQRKPLTQQWSDLYFDVYFEEESNLCNLSHEYMCSLNWWTISIKYILAIFHLIDNLLKHLLSVFMKIFIIFFHLNWFNH